MNAYRSAFTPDGRPFEPEARIQIDDDVPPHPGFYEARAKKRFALIPFCDVDFTTGQRWLVKGLMAATGLATIWGLPKTYKSFVAFDLCKHVVTGKPWAGRPVRRGAVVYVAGEGASGFMDRVAANRQRDNLPADLPFFVVKARPNLGAGDGDVADLIASIDPVISGLGVSLVLIVIDTLARTLAGSSENDEGMRNFTDNCERLAEHFDCLALAVHHAGKNADRGMRGSSALHGAVVTSWKVERSRDLQARVVLEDAKDGESGLAWTVDLEKYVHGHDEDGDEESVLIVSNVSDPVPEDEAGVGPAAAAKSQALPPQLRLFMACLDTAMGSLGRTAKPYIDGPQIRVVPVEAVRAEYFSRRGDVAKPDAKRKAFGYSLKSALERRLVLVEPADGEPVTWRARSE